MKQCLFPFLLSLSCFAPSKALSFMICPYCDPNYVAYPNLEEAMRGYDVPMGNPNPPRGDSDPGIRNQIFVPMVKANKKGHMALNDKFITANAQIKCDADWDSEVYDKYVTYVDGKTKTSTIGYGIEIIPEMSVNIMNNLLSNRFPPLYSRSWSRSNEVSQIKNFFHKDRGSIAVSQATCITHKVDIADLSAKQFLDPFVDSVRALIEVTPQSEERKKKELRRFINEFGTHYASTSEMGTKIVIERRYSFKERSLSDNDELKACNTLAGSQILGFKIENDKRNCSHNELTSDRISSKFVERTVISTYGSFISTDLIDWTKQVIDLVNQDSFNPRVIKRELRSILHLFEDKNFQGVDLDANMTSVLEWMYPMMLDYCGLFNLSCNPSGCGINDNCTLSEWCVQLEKEIICTPLDEPGKDSSQEEKDSNVTTILLPRDHKKEYYDNGNLEYEGAFTRGEKSGNGTLYYRNGIKGYVGSFKKGLMNGNGIMYYEESGKKLFEGLLSEGKFLKGTLFSESGEVLTQVHGRPKES